jgi:hypothetical protein
MGRSRARSCLLLAIIFCWPAVATAHGLGRIMVTSYTTIVIIGSLVSGFGKISIMDHVGDPTRHIGKLVALVLVIEAVLFTLVCAALVWANLLAKSIFTITLSICAIEFPLGVLVNWFFLTRPAKPKLVFWVPCVLSITFSLALILTSVLVVPIILEAIGA